MAFENTTLILLAIILGVLVGIAYSLRRMFILERKLKEAETKILTALKKAGCVLVKVGVETGSEELRKKILGRFMNNKQIIKVFDIARRIGLKTCTFNMIGVPGETKETIQDTINLNKRLKPEI